jgi:hypothetical protein
MHRQRLEIVVGVIAALALALLIISKSAVASSQEEKRAERVVGTAARDDAAAIAAFAEVAKVLRSPRCINCHATGDFPRIGDNMQRHAMNVRRGRDGRGVTAMKCSNCHQAENTAGAHRPPGAPNWHLPPAATPMIWEGLSNADICRQLKDPKQNGGKTVDQIVAHMSEDKLVLWGWKPGEGRTLPPLDHPTFAAKVKEWASKGAACALAVEM